MTAESLGDVVRASLAVKDIRPSTRRTYLVAVAPFMEMGMDDLSVIDLREVLDRMQNQNTRRKTIIALKSLVPHPAVKALRVPESVSKVYNLPDEATLRLALLTMPAHETRCLLMAYAGLRLGEACAISADDLDGRWLMVNKSVDDRTLAFVPVKTTAGRVPVPAWLLPQVQSLEGWANPKVVRWSLYRAGKRVGIHLNPHMLRHWYATALVKQGVPPNVVQRLLRHKNIALTFRVYAQVAHEDLTQAVDDLGRFTGL